MLRLQNYMKLSVLVALLAMVACNRPLTDDKMDGFDQGKKRFELTSSVANVSLDNGEKGFRLETMVRYSIGSKTNFRTERSAFLNKDYSVYTSTSKHAKGDEVTIYELTARTGGVDMKVTNPGGEIETVPFDSVAPLYVELHALLYTNDLKVPNTEKSYPIISEVDRRIVDLTVKFVGPDTIYEDGKPSTALHYRIQAISNPTEFDDYYIDPKTKEIRRIQFGMIEFKPKQS